jgi:hypothetical protein
MPVLTYRTAARAQPKSFRFDGTADQQLSRSRLPASETLQASGNGFMVPPRLPNRMDRSRERPTAHLFQVLCERRTSRSVHSEQVVDTNCRYLNVVVAGSEGVPGENREGSRNREGSAAQTEIIILGPHRPIVGKGPFKAATNQPTTDGVAAASADRRSGGHVSDREAVGADPTPTTLDINEPAVKGVAKPPRYRRHPSIIGARREIMAERANNPRDAIVVVRRPVKIPFGAEYDIADLVIEPNLAAAYENAVISIAEVQAEEAIGYCSIGPSSAEIATDIKSTPAKYGWHRRRRFVSGRWRRRHIGGASRSGPHREHR